MSSRQIVPLLDRVEAIITVPGSKSYTNRALLLSSLVKKVVTIHEALDSDDTQAMVGCLSSLNIAVKKSGTTLTVTGDIDDVMPGEYKLDCRLSGTTIRFMTALACILPGQQVLTGGEGLLNRPISDIVDSLRSLGAEIEYLDEHGKPPLLVKSSTLSGKSVEIRGDSSSQFVSALLMIAPALDSLEIKTTGTVISTPYIDMTLETMEKFGVKVDRDKYARFSIQNTAYDIDDYIVEGDISSASYFFAAAALTKSKITVKNVNAESSQADMGFLRILEDAGNEVIRNRTSITLIGHGVKLFNVDMELCPDQAQTLAVLASLAEGTTVISGVQSLRVKETERVQAIENELNRVGVKTSSTHSTLTIHGGTANGPARIETYNDHRMAMAFSLLGLKLTGIAINDPNVVSKTFPDYWAKFDSLYTKERRSNIVLIGMRGSGKSHVAAKLAQLVDFELLDLDRLLAKKLEMPISDFVNKYGWESFRHEEGSLIARLSTVTNSIISTGGGAVLDSHNTDILSRHGVVYWLSASPETLETRVTMSSNRPALTTATTLKEEIEIVLAERKDIYKAVADYVINTDNKAPDSIAKEILMRLGIKAT
jgi:3-phosphoshikimate 1-carboxyvinyltransferase